MWYLPLSKYYQIHRQPGIIYINDVDALNLLQEELTKNDFFNLVQKLRKIGGDK